MAAFLNFDIKKFVHCSQIRQYSPEFPGNKPGRIALPGGEKFGEFLS